MNDTRNRCEHEADDMSLDCANQAQFTLRGGKQTDADLDDSYVIGSYCRAHATAQLDGLLTQLAEPDCRGDMIYILPI